MSDMVERVAKAIEATMFADHELPCDAELHEKYCGTARAAISAMREPTEEMLSHGDSSIPRAEADKDGHRMMGREVCLEAWKAMIDAALE